jgi:hypothetical protein
VHDVPAEAPGNAFGVLYSSIWQLAAVLGSPRLTPVTLGAITAPTGWVVLGHNLWERRSAQGDVRNQGIELQRGHRAHGRAARP